MCTRIGHCPNPYPCPITLEVSRLGGCLKTTHMMRVVYPLIFTVAKISEGANLNCGIWEIGYQQSCLPGLQGEQQRAPPSPEGPTAAEAGESRGPSTILAVEEHERQRLLEVTDPHMAGFPENADVFDGRQRTE